MSKPETRGGHRPNSGRKAKDANEKAVTVSFCLTPAQKEALQAAVKASGMNQSNFILSKLFPDS